MRDISLLSEVRSVDRQEGLWTAQYQPQRSSNTAYSLVAQGNDSIHSERSFEAASDPDKQFHHEFD